MVVGQLGGEGQAPANQSAGRPNGIRMASEGYPKGIRRGRWIAAAVWRGRGSGTCNSVLRGRLGVCGQPVGPLLYSTTPLLFFQTPHPSPLHEPWKHPTSNIERPTSNDCAGADRCMFDVGFWMLGVLLARLPPSRLRRLDGSGAI